MRITDEDLWFDEVASRLGVVPLDGSDRIVGVDGDVTVIKRYDNRRLFAALLERVERLEEAMTPERLAELKEEMGE